MAPHRLYPAIRTSIEVNFERDGTEVYARMEPGAAAAAADAATSGAGAVATAPAGGESAPAGEAGSAAGESEDGRSSPAPSAKAPVPLIAHDTVGWKALESSTQALGALVEGCGSAVCSPEFLTPDLLNTVVPRAAAHVNRFVRQAIFGLCTAVVEASGGDGLRSLGWATKLSELIGTGLADNWSQVWDSPPCALGP